MPPVIKLGAFCSEWNFYLTAERAYPYICESEWAEFILQEESTLNFFVFFFGFVFFFCIGWNEKGNKFADRHLRFREMADAVVDEPSRLLHNLDCFCRLWGSYCYPVLLMGAGPIDRWYCCSDLGTLCSSPVLHVFVDCDDTEVGSLLPYCMCALWRRWESLGNLSTCLTTEI